MGLFGGIAYATAFSDSDSLTDNMCTVTRGTVLGASGTTALFIAATLSAATEA